MSRALRESALVGAIGAVQTAAFVHTATLWWLPLAGAAVLAAAVSVAPPGRAALLGSAYGTGWLLAGVWWLYISMHRYGGLPALLAAAAVLLLALGLPLLLAAAMAVVARWRSGRPLADAALFACAWLAAELARGTLFTGFPWVASGYAQVDGPLAWLAPWIGVYGIGAVGAFAAGLAAATWRGGRHGWRRPALALVAAAAAATLPGARGPIDFTRPGATLRVALLQTDVPQDEKFALERLPETLTWLADALTSARADLIVAPETAIPLPPHDLAQVQPAYWQALQAYFSRPGAPAALIGAPLGDSRSGYTNSVVALAPSGTPYRYDKSHLVPFGEFIPTGFHWFTEMMDMPLGDFNRGRRDPPSFVWRGERIAPNICYEDLFGEELALRFADAATAPTILVNVSNIAWFGDTIAVPQHLAISRMRSLELQRPMLRSTNTGATAVVDHRGVVLATLEPFTRGVLDSEVQGRVGRTPFARWAAVAGLWPLAALAALGLGAVALCRARERRREPRTDR